MIRVGSIVALLIAAAVGAFLYAGTWEASSPKAQVSASAASEEQDRCVTREVALDEGYGVSRTETRVACKED